MRIAGALIVLGACGLGCAGAADLPEAAVNELGVTPGTPQMKGFVFVEGRYLAPPYTVSRKGNALFVNRVQFEQPVAWSRFEASKAPETKAVDADGDFQKVEDAPAKPAAANKIDDLFADNGAQTNDAQRAAEGDKDAPAAAESKRSPEELKQLKDELRKSLDGRRKAYEAALGQGEIFFFGQRHNRVNGNYGTARTLMGVLPKALREAQSPQDLLQRLNDGGVFFVDAGICSALFKNKSTFPQLEERLKKIQEDEALEAERRKRASR